MKGLKILKNNDIPIRVACVITEPSEVEEILDFFVEHEIYNIKFMPCHDQGRGVNLKKLNIKEYANAHMKILDKAIYYNKVNEQKIKLKCLAPLINNITTFKRQFACFNSPCGAGSQNIAVGSDGRILPCDYMFGCKNEEKFVLGNIFEKKSLIEVIDDSVIIKEIRQRDVKNIQECSICPWKYICCGGCTTESYGEFQNLKNKSKICEYYLIVIEELIWKIFEDYHGVISVIDKA
jgi:radical SAM protein with 4Fe4S-binding SPASM domain